MKNYIKFITLLIIFCVSLISCVKKKQDRIAIRFSTWGGAIEMNVWQATINRFEEKNPDIKITLEMLSGGYQDKLQAMLASETAPDVFYVDHSSMFFRFVSDKVLLNLDPLIKSDKNMDLNDFFPGALDMFRVNGHLYAFPKDLHTFALYYNKDIFDEADLDYPDESWDWNTFIRASKKLTIDKNNDGILDQYGFTWDPRYWMMLVYQNGGRLFNKKKSKCLMSDKKVMEAIRFLRDTLHKNKSSINPQTIKYQELNQNFMTGKIAMYISGVWVGAEFRQSGFRWDVAPLPKGKIRATALVGSGPCVYAHTQYPKESYEFAKFAVSPEAQKIYSELGVSIPTRKSIAYSPCFLNPKSPPENARVFLDQIKYGYTLEPDDFESGDEIYMNIIQPELDKVWFQNISPEKICPIIENRVNEFLLNAKQ